MSDKTAFEQFVNPNNVYMQHNYCLHVLHSLVHFIGWALPLLERVAPNSEKLEKMREVYTSVSIQLDNEMPMSEVEAELEDLRRDAARYRLLRVSNIQFNVKVHLADGSSPYMYAEALDEVLDYRLAEKGE